MEIYRIENYIVRIDTDGKGPGEQVDVHIRHERFAERYESVYRLIWAIGDNAVDLARRAFFHYKMRIRDGKDAQGGVKSFIIDETGAERYTMTAEKLHDLYRQLGNFVADCTIEEYKENKDAIAAIYTLIHKHINSTPI